MLTITISRFEASKRANCRTGCFSFCRRGAIYRQACQIDSLDSSARSYCFCRLPRVINNSLLKQKRERRGWRGEGGLMKRTLTLILDQIFLINVTHIRLMTTVYFNRSTPSILQKVFNFTIFCASSDF